MGSRSVSAGLIFLQTGWQGDEPYFGHVGLFAAIIAPFCGYFRAFISTDATHLSHAGTGKLAHNLIDGR